MSTMNWNNEHKTTFLSKFLNKVVGFWNKLSRNWSQTNNFFRTALFEYPFFVFSFVVVLTLCLILSCNHDIFTFTCVEYFSNILQHKKKKHFTMSDILITICSYFFNYIFNHSLAESIHNGLLINTHFTMINCEWKK